MSLVFQLLKDDILSPPPSSLHSFYYSLFIPFPLPFLYLPLGCLSHASVSSVFTPTVFSGLLSL